MKQTFIYIFLLLIGTQTYMAAEAVAPSMNGFAASHRVVLDANWRVISSADLPVAGEKISSPDFAPDKKWLPAVVPGTVLDSCVKAGFYPEPFEGLNNLITPDEQGIFHGKIPDASVPGSAFTVPWWYRTAFQAPADFQGKTVWLKLAGVNWRAGVFLNGQNLGTITGAYQRGIFNITKLVHSGENVLAVRIDPMLNPGNPPPHFYGCGGDGNMGFTPAAIYQTVGMDFSFIDGIRDRNMGIIREVTVYASGAVDVRDPFMSTDGVPTKDAANLNFKTVLVNGTDKAQTGKLKISFASQEVSQEVTLARNETREVALGWDKFPQLTLKNPKLWWPAGRGEQALYPMQVSFNNADGMTGVERNFGVRSIENKPELGQSVYWVNGKKMFLAGGNWVQDIMQRQTPAREEAQVRMIRNAGFTWLRLWSGSGPMDDALFDLCDKYGIMAWVESGLIQQVKKPQTNSVWCQTILDNWADYILRVRSHPCVFNYVACNEGPDIPHMDEEAKKYDGTRGYSASSEDLGQRGCPYVWCGVDGYYDSTSTHSHGTGPLGLFGGFCNESGAPCLPVAEVIKEMIPPDKQSPLNKDLANYLDGGAFHRIYQFVTEGCAQFGDLSKPDLAGRTGVDNYAFKGQMLNAMVYRALGELWQREKFDKNGRFSTGWGLWTVNNTHPQLCARIYDYTLEPTAGLYYLAHANKPFSLQFNYRDNSVTAVNNTFTIPKGMNVTAEIRGLDWSLQWSKRQVIAPDRQFLPESSRMGILYLPNKDQKKLDDVHFIHLQLSSGKEILDDTIYWRTKDGMLYGADGDFSALNKMPATQIKATTQSEMKDGKRFVTVTLENSSKQIAFFLRVKVLGAKTKTLVRPCYYSDNYFSVLPGAKKEITIECPATLGDEAPVIGIEGWNIGTLELAVPASKMTPEIRPHQN